MLNLFLENPWHYVSLGENSPTTVRAIVEIPKGSKAKYELDKESGMLKMERVLFSAVHYPANYGFIPQTLCEDGDPLDILILMSIPVEPMCIVDAKVIGVMPMLDCGVNDEKIIAVAANDMSVNHINDISEVPPHLLKEILRFFEDYKKLENKEVKVESCLGRQAAFKCIKDKIELYQQTFFREIEVIKKKSIRIESDMPLV